MERSNKNIEAPGSVNHCTSCQMCAAVCPVNCISFTENDRGFYRPQVDAEKCVECGLCQSVCYKYDRNAAPADPPEGATLYGAWAKDPAVVAATTSGGIADLLAKALIGEGYVCCGASYDSRTARAVHVTADTAEATDCFRGSKYIQSFTARAFTEVAERLRKGERVAVFGVPCQIYAWHRYAVRKHFRDRLLLVDLYCHGCPSMLVWDKCLKEIKESAGGDNVTVCDVNFRSKSKGWGTYVLEASVDADGVLKKVTNGNFYNLFFSDDLLNRACYDCASRSSLAACDIRLGDFWGKEYVGNDRGVSAVTICTDCGRDAYSLIADAVEAVEKDLSSFLPYQSYGKVYKMDPALRKRLFAGLADPSVPLSESVRAIYSARPLKKRVIWRLKQWLGIFPPGMMRAIKRLYYRLS